MRTKLVHRMLVLVLFAWGCADAPDPGVQDSEEQPWSVDNELEEGDLASEQSSLVVGDAGFRRQICGGPLGLRCGSSEVCAVPSSNGQCPGPRAYGTCQPQRLCPQIFDPVCGCNGKTFSNACSAAAAGVAVQYDGECVPNGPFCGGFAGITCPGEGSCVDDPRDDCDPANGGADCGGICTCRQPHTCPAGGRFDPRPGVCACVRAPILCPNAPCTVTSCAAGTQCVERDCKAVCEPVGGCLPCPSGKVCTDVCFPGPVLTQ